MTAETQLDIFDQLKQALENKIPVATVTVVRGAWLGAKLLVLPDRTEGTLGSAQLDEIAAADARVLLDAEKSETRPYSIPGSDEEIDLFIETFPQPPTLLIFAPCMSLRR